MEDYQERVLVEQKELGEKIVKLIKFLTDYEKVKLLDDNDRCCLQIQLEAMLDYHEILVMRLDSFPL